LKVLLENINLDYQIRISETAEKIFSRLEREIQKRIVKKIEILSENPYKYGKKLKSPEIGTYRLQVGDYRVIYDIEDIEKSVLILHIGHRKNIYK